MTIDLTAANNIAGYLWYSPFNLKVFATSPKCTGKWCQSDGSGCLWTAFFRAFGYEVNSSQTRFSYPGQSWLDFMPNSEVMKQTVQAFLQRAGLPTEYSSVYLTRMHSYKYVATGQSEPHGPIIRKVEDDCFLNHTINLYDHNEEVKALHLIWNLIDRLPNKVGAAHEVQMPRGEVVCLK